MRIAQMPPLYEAVPPLRGTQRVVAAPTDALADLGHEVTIASPHQGDGTASSPWKPAFFAGARTSLPSNALSNSSSRRLGDPRGNHWMEPSVGVVAYLGKSRRTSMKSHASSVDDVHGSVPERARTVMLILDMFSDFEFVDGTRTARLAWPVAQRIATLKARLRQHRAACVYVNDNLGRWRADFPSLLKRCGAPGSRGASIARLLRPDARDYCLLKPRHSGFFATALEAILERLGTRTLILTGTTSPQCILFTATDAYVRHYELIIPSDCVVSRSRREQTFTKYFFRSVLKARVCRGASLRLPTLAGG